MSELPFVAPDREPDPTFLSGDAVAVLRSLRAGFAHAIITDPAYESLEKHRARGTTTRLAHSTKSSNDWFGVFENARFPAFLDECYRVLVPMSYCLILCDEETADILKPLARNSGFWVWGSWTWVKTKAKGPERLPVADQDPEVEASEVRIGMGYHGRRSTERILVLEKRSVDQIPQGLWTVRSQPRGRGRKLNHLGWPDVFFDPRVDGGYPTEKPVSLLKKLISQVTNVGERIVDPFCGSGSTLVAAYELDRLCTVSDIKSEALALAMERYDDAKDARAKHRKQAG